MPERDDLGQLINDARVGRGQSLGQLADRLGVTAAQLRAWEKNEARPDAAALQRLAVVLHLDYGRLSAAATATVAPPPQPRRPSGTAAEPGDATALVAAGMVFSDAADTGLDVSSTPAPAPAEARPRSDGPPRLEDLPTEAVAPVAPPRDPVPVAATPTPAATREPDSSLMSGALHPVTGFLRTLFDPERRYLFWIRTALTVVAILIMFRILATVVPAFFDTLGDILDTIESTTDSTVLDQFGNPITPTSIPGTTITPDG